MTFDEARAYYGGSSYLMSKKLCVSYSCVRYWKRRNKIPYPYQCQIEVDTRGLAGRASPEDREPRAYVTKDGKENDTN